MIFKGLSEIYVGIKRILAKISVKKLLAMVFTYTDFFS